MLYQSTCVGFGYGLAPGLFPGSPSPPAHSTKCGRGSAFVTSGRPRTINLVPIDYAFRPRLRGRLTLRGLTLRRNPWTFGERVFHSLYRYSCQHSHFRCLQEPLRAPFAGLRNAPLPNQRTDVRRQMSDLAAQPVQHLRDRLILVSPTLPRLLVDVVQIATISDPDTHLVRRTERDRDVAPELRFRHRLLCKAFRKIGADRLARPPHLLG